jgi:amino acid adenylation domain-containing protein
MSTLTTSTFEDFLPDPTRALRSDWEMAVHTRFSQQAKRVPEHTAVLDKQSVWTYSELEARSNQLAHYLLANNIQPQDVVAIYGHRSASLVWALLGILKAGAAFIILDPTYPAPRLIEYLQVTKPRGWIQLEAAGALPGKLQEFITTLSCCRLELPPTIAVTGGSLLTNYSTLDPKVIVGPDDLAYITFTSGTTGKPNAVQGTQRPLAHFLQWHCQTFNLKETDCFSMLSGLSHDPLLRDVFTPLWLGARLCIPDPNNIFPDQLVNWLNQYEISVIHLTPVMGRFLTSDAKSVSPNTPFLRYAFFGGDVLTRHDVFRLRKLAPSVTCVNFYGATETPQAMGYFIIPNCEEASQDDYLVNTKEIIPLGRGIQDVQLLVFNEAQQLVGIGELGEIYIRTAYLAKGYLGDETLTQDRFIPNPFTQIFGDQLYRTGDLGRYLPDGNVEFAGRRDQQVKIRGFRIELTEVEASLREHPAVQETAVIALEDALGDKRLVAYLVSSESQVPLINELYDFLKDKLPNSMLPSAFVFLEAMPLTPNGKLDRKALPPPNQDRPQLKTIYTAPRTPVEEILTKTWAEVLKLDQVGIYDNFFELGGYSLLAIQIASRILDNLQVKLPLHSLFEKPTVAELAEVVEKAKDSNTGPSILGIVPVSREFYRVKRSSLSG